MADLLTPQRARWLLGAYVISMLAVVWQPMPRAAVGSVNLGYWVSEHVGLGALITPTMVEFAMNAACSTWPLVAMREQRPRNMGCVDDHPVSVNEE